MMPLEINKKICELKGMPLESFQVNSQKIYVNYKDWAESIQDAWELFEELQEKTEYNIWQLSLLSK